MKTLMIVRASLAALALLASAGCGMRSHPMQLSTSPDRGAGITASSNLIVVPFDPANFVRGVDNPYYPLRPGTILTYRTTSKSGVQINTIEVTGDRKTILGVPITVVHDAVFIEDGSLSEDTLDWFAQDKQGNLWYFGEDTRTLDHGTLISTTGSWEAGKNGAQAGVIMLAHPHVGDQYQQENSPGIVADMAKVIGLDETATVPAGTYPHCVETTEWTPLEPGDRAHKFYALGIGTVLETSTRQGGERVELISVK